jgi:hypothetical protein
MDGAAVPGARHDHHAGVAALGGAAAYAGPGLLRLVGARHRRVLGHARLLQRPLQVLVARLPMIYFRCQP